jgi:transmembrane sensor
MHYLDYDTEDFLKDEKFKSWVFHPDHDSDFYWNSFMESFPEKTAFVLRAKKLLLSFRFTEEKLVEPGDEEQRELYQRILNYRPVKSMRKRTNSYFFNHILENGSFRVAAIITMALIASFLLFRTDVKQEEEPVVKVNMVTKSAPYGQRLTTTLPDGSTVKLNSGSTITYPEIFLQVREVKLEGEAFFEIKRNTDWPFVVETDNIRTEVMGTSFNVRNYGGNSGIEVALLSGKIQVNLLSDNDLILDRVILEPMHMAVLNKNNKGLYEKSFTYNQVLGWKDNLLSFRNAGIDEILETLERWYGVNFVVRKKFGKEKDFNAEYYNKSLLQILEGVSYSFDFKFTIDDKTVTIE